MNYVPAVITRYDVVVQGIPLGDSIVEVSHPPIKEKTRDTDPPGSSLPKKIYLGKYEEMSLGLTVNEPVTLLFDKFGLGSGDELSVIVAGAGKLNGPDGLVVPFWINYKGKIEERDFGTWKDVADIEFKFSLNVTYVKIRVAAKEVFFTDGKVVRENEKDKVSDVMAASLNF